MINSAVRTPFCEEMAKGLLTTVPAAGRAGQSDCAKLRTEHPQNMMTSNQSDREHIGRSFPFPGSNPPRSKATKLRLLLQRGPTVTGVTNSTLPFSPPAPLGPSHL